MFRKRIHIILLLIIAAVQLQAQVAMPDTVCVGTSRVYKVNDPSVPSTYTWRIDGVIQSSTRNELPVNWTVPGVYQITVQEHANNGNGCDGDIRSGTVNVIPPPVANAGPDLRVCFGNTAQLSGSGGNGFQWTPVSYLSSPSVSNPIVRLPAAGVYPFVLNVTNFGCSSLKPDTVLVTMLPPVEVFAGRDTFVTVNQLLQLNATDVRNSGFISYGWSPPAGLSNSNIKNPVTVLNTPGSIVYTVTARTADGCEDKDDIKVVAFVKADLYVPTAFTPNGDGLNDFAKVIPVGIKELKFFSIYGRWGELVFTTNDWTRGWDGNYKGKNQDSNVFVWVAEAIDYNGNVITRKGTVTLIR